MKIYKRYLTRSLLFVCCLSFLSSCISPKDTNYLQSNREPYYSTKIFEDYRLQINDEIYCTIFTTETEFAELFNGIITQTESISGNTQANRLSYNSQNYVAYRIHQNGNVSIPYFGDVYVLGMTLVDAERAIQRKMAASYPDAQVKVRLRNGYFYVVSGEKNGVYGLYKDNMTIYQALSISGYLSDNIDYGKVKIVRTRPDGESIVKTFDLRTESVIESDYYYIKPNDVIYFSTSKSSFFKANSFTSLFGLIVGPLMYLGGMIIWFISD